MTRKLPQNLKLALLFIIGFFMGVAITGFFIGEGISNIHNSKICFSREVGELIIRSWYDG